ncbi:MAG: Asp-tRNA(Asn)/Glu-tRNA(Gln) amidotransferase subunit GatC [Oscillospiraceae bacterium]|jgi:aspartyl-tRNA(Asn)/glutamyl-tRNA(Gln) amidotransferase subunit C|nr:Asp-tRNA(Asn)/Glu-tRNA(Gln) amidotransferase subunit GatC [Oscillospiraceae bacterium]
MEENITKEKILDLAKIAKLSIEEKDLEKITQNMKNIINFAIQVSEAKISEKPCAYVLEKTKGRLRQDIVCPSFPQEEILSGACESENGFFKIKNQKF